MSRTVTVQILREPNCDDIPLPAYETEHAAGMDLRASVTVPQTLQPGERALIPTGLRIALPEGYEAQIRPRSGLALKHGISLLNTPGTIDADYRGEVKVLLINHGPVPFVIETGVRIAQLVVAAYAAPTIVETESLDETERGAGGFGSTGV